VAGAGVSSASGEFRNLIAYKYKSPFTYLRKAKKRMQGLTLEEDLRLAVNFNA
jgi:hypothetical protein